MGCRLLFFLFFLVIFDLQGLDVLQPDGNAELQGGGDVFPPGVRGGGASRIGDGLRVCSCSRAGSGCSLGLQRPSLPVHHLASNSTSPSEISY